MGARLMKIQRRAVNASFAALRRAARSSGPFCPVAVGTCAGRTGRRRTLVRPTRSRRRPSGPLRPAAAGTCAGRGTRRRRPLPPTSSRRRFLGASLAGGGKSAALAARTWHRRRPRRSHWQHGRSHRSCGSGRRRGPSLAGGGTCAELEETTTSPRRPFPEHRRRPRQRSHQCRSAALRRARRHGRRRTASSLGATPCPWTRRRCCPADGGSSAGREARRGPRRRPGPGSRRWRLSRQFRILALHLGRQHGKTRTTATAEQPPLASTRRRCGLTHPANGAAWLLYLSRRSCRYWGGRLRALGQDCSSTGHPRRRPDRWGRCPAPLSCLPARRRRAPDRCCRPRRRRCPCRRPRQPR
mmetsp:Transcript_50599/g.159307  ORF Transcript_50599/g.159307 Transcript_50599/m.159307 type:complete len:356 (+) Transcript_50599:1127-2194(+)